MAIEFHCHYCGKLVKAPDEAGGKRGKCPFCKNILYIPMADDQVEEVDLAPVDEEDERRRQQLLEESIRTEMQLLKERQAGPDLGPPKPDDESSLPDTLPLSPEHPEDVEALVVQWIRAMADGQLAEAERTLDVLRRNRKIALEAAERLAMEDPPPPGLVDIPRPVLTRYFRSLMEQV